MMTPTEFAEAVRFPRAALEGLCGEASSDDILWAARGRDYGDRLTILWAVYPLSSVSAATNSSLVSANMPPVPHDGS